MKIVVKSAFAAAALSMIAGSALAQTAANTDTVTSNSTARIIQPITLAQTGSLGFGTIIRPRSGNDVVTVDKDGNRSKAGDAVLLGGTVEALTYTVSGEGAQAFTATVPTTFNLTGTSGNTIAVTLLPGTLPTVLSGTADASQTAGTATFKVGGSIPVASNTPTGSYTGSFNVTVAYN